MFWKRPCFWSVVRLDFPKVGHVGQYVSSGGNASRLHSTVVVVVGATIDTLEQGNDIVLRLVVQAGQIRLGTAGGKRHEVIIGSVGGMKGGKAANGGEGSQRSGTAVAHAAGGAGNRSRGSLLCSSDLSVEEGVLERVLVVLSQFAVHVGFQESAGAAAELANGGGRLLGSCFLGQEEFGHFVLLAVGEPVKVGFGGGGGSQFAANALDADAGHALENVGTSTKEEFVVVSVAVRASCEAAESVEVDLPLERSELCLTEVSWHDFLHKAVGLMHNEASSVRHPRDDIVQSVFLDLVEHLVELFGEGNEDASAGSTTLGGPVVGLVDGLVVVVHIVVLHVDFVVATHFRDGHGADARRLDQAADGRGHVVIEPKIVCKRHCDGGITVLNVLCRK